MHSLVQPFARDVLQKVSLSLDQLLALHSKPMPLGRCLAELQLTMWHHSSMAVRVRQGNPAVGRVQRGVKFTHLLPSAPMAQLTSVPLMGTYTLAMGGFVGGT